MTMIRHLVCVAGLLASVCQADSHLPLNKQVALSVADTPSNAVTLG